MAAFKVNLKIDQGATFAKHVTWKAGTPPVPVDLTGCTARMQVREKIESPVALLDLTTENGGIVLGGTSGTIDYCLLSDELTATFAWTSGVYDLEIVFPDGTVQRKIAGNVTVSPEVTRS